ncbi:GNAT family N-acetyltransferase [Flavobacterium microcysteis]|uniref:GNAT family N-acetyltransferase n=1 Tax=Flavobacterium microcysteis TaxID=2596891 RepID=A0A501QFT5_9FLAO|nr:GNAT family N-acetyltransferase [Flavobacterium microcysteis]TPD71262.1 GNAT family N-acetyltransferase [Flavobacterium microcysteis]
MKIERSEKNDNLILSEITFEGKAYWGYGKEQLEKWRNDLTITQDYIENNETFKLIVDDEIIGYYSILKLENKIIKLDYLFLLPKFIGKGYGKFLMNHCIKKAKEINMKKIILDSDPNAELFYKSFGFKTYNQLKTSIENRFLPQMELDIE